MESQVCCRSPAELLPRRLGNGGGRGTLKEASVEGFSVSVPGFVETGLTRVRLKDAQGSAS